MSTLASSPAPHVHGEQSPGQSTQESPVPWRRSSQARPSDGGLSALSTWGHTAATSWAGPPSNLNWVSSWFWRKFIQFTGLKRLLHPRGQADEGKGAGKANIIERRGKQGVPRRPGGMSPGEAKRADDNCQMSFITQLCLYLLPTSLNNCPLGPKLSLFSLSPKVSWQEVWAKLFRASGSYACRQWNDIVSAFKINKRVFGHRELSNENSEMAEPPDIGSPYIPGKQTNLRDLGGNGLNKEAAGVWGEQGRQADSVSNVQLFSFRLHNYHGMETAALIPVLFCSATEENKNSLC